MANKPPPFAQIAPSGNSEGSIYRGRDGNAYQVIDGRDVRVSDDKLIVKGWKPLPETITVDGITFHRDKSGKFFIVQNNKLIPISQADLQKLDAERFGGQLEQRLEQEGRKQQGTSNYALYAVGALILLLLLRD
jgi:hypothetical protein